MALTVKQYYVILHTPVIMWLMTISLIFHMPAFVTKPDTYFENGFIEESIISPGINQNTPPPPFFVRQPLIHIGAPSCSHYCTSL